MKIEQKPTRRRFLCTTAAVVATGIVPRWILGGPGQTPPSERLNVAIIGTGGQGITNLKSETWSRSPRIIPETKRKRYQLPPPTLLRSRGHHRDWIDACKGGPPASANFEYSARLTEIVLLGVVALRSRKTLHWDGPAMTATNVPEAEPLIHGYFRKGWEI